MTLDEHTSNTIAPDMGKVYDDFAQAFAEADKLPTWRFIGKPAMEDLIRPHVRPGARFLDLGSASARVEAGVLLPLGVLPQDIVGVEISPEQVEIAKKRIPGATFVVGDITEPSLLSDKDATFDVVFSHMVFEHVSDAQFAQVCASAKRLLKPGGVFLFVVTHPEKMTDLNGQLVKEYGAFETTAPWGGVLHNWRRSVDDTAKLVRDAGFKVDLVESIPFPKQVPQGLDAEGLSDFEQALAKYKKYPAIRLAVSAVS